MNQPQFGKGDRVRVKDEDQIDFLSDPPPDDAFGKRGTVEMYGGWFGSGSVFPIRYVHHNNVVRIDGVGLRLVNEDWLEAD